MISNIGLPLAVTEKIDMINHFHPRDNVIDEKVTAFNGVGGTIDLYKWTLKCGDSISFIEIMYNRSTQRASLNEISTHISELKELVRRTA